MKRLSVAIAGTAIALGTRSVDAVISFNLTQTAKPLSPTDTPSAPEPSFLLASLLAGGGLLNAKRKQKK
ncbi:MAG: PEP-CTERM sorting domain-containing protein [Coleofasciculus chthonoplastes F3-SA18-01]|uniref:PEP-CTERM sorting domain-containing protein n=1 Tax=Coleofasciculus chthonoplastes TaxID=64178 RepID=UPI0032F7310A